MLKHFFIIILISFRLMGKVSLSILKFCWQQGELGLIFVIIGRGIYQNWGQNSSNTQHIEDKKKEKQQLAIQDYIKSKIIVGETGVGKTSILNFLLGKNYPVGLGNCTIKKSLVFKTQSIKIYDCFPFDTDEFSCQQQIYESISKQDQIFVCFCSSLKGISKFIKYLVQIKKYQSVYFIRTKCDNFNERQLKTFEEEKQTDKSLLIQYGFPAQKINIYGVSTKPSKFVKYQNEEVKQLLLRK